MTVDREGVEATVNGAAALSRDQANARARASFVSGADAGDEDVADDDVDAPPPAAKAKAAGDKPTGGDDDELDVDLDDDEVEADDDEADELDADADTDPDADADPKRLDAVRRAASRVREQLATQRKADHAEREAFVAEWKPKIDAAERFEALKAKGLNAYNVVEVALSLGMSEEDLEEGARVMFAASAKGKADPKNREALSRSKRERELADEVRELKRWRDDREAGEKQSTEAAANAKAADRYLDGIAKATPAGSLASHFLETAPDKTRRAFAKIAIALTNRNGAPPATKDVHAAYERIRAKELRSLGVDPATITKSTTTKTTTKPEKKTTAKPIIVADDSDDAAPLTRAAFVGGKYD